MRAKEKCPGLREQSQGHKNKFTAISLAKTGGKVNGKVAVHVVLINSFSQFANQVFKCDEKYTTEIDYVLNCMQNARRHA